ncbi:uncharacterized protein LOC126267923 [Schistocerca gregaria]|uniref:uncharacterized protein LOC126267923 n=1 Tax=Schistocerca gregaria TaxID=7010 RepID=UPI00211F2239|nr:uncharacterized protein LOC126267923 [Schistocerca gregaria]
MTIRTQGTTSNIFLEGVKVDYVSHFKFLGSVISKVNIIKQETLSMTQKAANFYSQIRNLPWDDEMPKNSKASMYPAYFLPVLTYGLETCSVLKKGLSRIQATEIRFTITMNQTTRKDKIRNEVNKKVADTEDPVTSLIQKCRLQWYGHIMRMNSRRPAIMYFNLSLIGRRP